MIASDQPTIFPDTVRVAVSSVDDGSMKDGVDLMTPEAIVNREQFLRLVEMNAAAIAVFYADYDTKDFCQYNEATAGLMLGSDGVSTQQPGQPMLLPIADCVATVLYDPAHNALMVSHLGRHSTEQYGGRKSVEYMTHAYGTQPEKLLVWLGPSPNGVDYPLRAFDGRSFVDVLIQQLRDAGVVTDHIEVSRVDTSTNQNYFSHSQFLKGKQAIDGRYAVAAMII